MNKCKENRLKRENPLFKQLVEIFDKPVSQEGLPHGCIMVCSPSVKKLDKLYDSGICWIDEIKEGCLLDNVMFSTIHSKFAYVQLEDVRNTWSSSYLLYVFDNADNAYSYWDKYFEE